MYRIVRKTSHFVGLLEGIYYDVLALAVRLYMALIFFRSGRLKFQNYLDDNWQATVYLFQEVHPVPLLPPEIAAVLGTAGELVLSALLVLGLFGRLAAFGLMVMTVFIQIALPEEIHFYWIIIFALLLAKGMGRIAVDQLFSKRYFDKA